MNSREDQLIPKGYDPGLYRIRHSLAHVLAKAVLEKFVDAKFAIGPPIDDGFYYDFEFSSQPSEEDLAAIEARMREIVKERAAFEMREVSADEARQLFHDQPYKLELIADLVTGVDPEAGDSASGEAVTLTVYEIPGFVDLCQGPHVESPAHLDPTGFKLLNMAGAYWRGDENRAMLTRIYATAWKNKKDLKRHLARIEEAKLYDHRKLGRELELFTTSQLVGAGLPLWLPKGATIRRLLENYIVDLETANGYDHVYTPTLAKTDLYHVSGHWEHYQEDMFPPMDIGGETLVLRPMNCPHHISVFMSSATSYRDLPVRIAELGTMFRYERSGVLSGLTRVRGMTLNDAHIFCRADQVKKEFGDVVRLMGVAYATLGIEDYRFRLSLRDPRDEKKYVKNDEMWDSVEEVIREAMIDLKVPFDEAPGEAAFYGPKLDVQIKDLMGREETLSTVQIDFHLPNQFDMSYRGEDSKPHRPVIIHRAIISTMERMVAYLIELYRGAFPVWLAPVQATVIPVADEHDDYARQVAERLKAEGFRATVNLRDMRMNAKIREAQLMKIPFILIVGSREMESDGVSVRLRSGKRSDGMSLDDFVRLLRDVVDSKSLELSLG